MISFIHIPRTGGTTVKQELPGLRHLGHSQVKELDPKEEYFTFVRDPLDRAVSLWSFNKENGSTRKGCSEFWKSITGLNWHMEQQCYWLPNSPHEQSNLHLLSFSTFREGLEAMAKLTGDTVNELHFHKSPLHHDGLDALAKKTVKRLYAEDLQLALGVTDSQLEP